MEAALAVEAGTLLETGVTLSPDDVAAAEALPETLYRAHVVDCDAPENAFAFDFMSDYLSMMDMLAKSIAHQLSAACAITPLQYRIMLQLLGDEAVHATDLVKSLLSGPSTVSVAIGKLTAAGLVSRHEDSCDMRIVGLRLTDAGRRTLKRADAAIVTVMADYWRSLTREQLQAALRSSISAVQRHSTPRMEDGKQRLDTALVDTVMISRMLTTRALHQEGLTPNDFRVVLALRVLGGQSTASAIADFLFLNSSDITSCLKNLEGMGLIARQRSASNRRVRPIELTAKGRAQLSRLMTVVFDALHETCHSDDELIRAHISAARDLVARKRQQSVF